MAPAIRAAVAGALSLVFPTWCAGCDAPDDIVCAECRRELEPRVVRRSIAELPVYAGLTFAGVPARVIRACKEEGRTALAGALAPALAAAADAALAWASSERVSVVAVPTSAAAMRRRGYRVVELLASRAGLHPQRLLRVNGRAADQRALGVSERARNVAGTFQVPARQRLRLEGRAVLLVDDVVTTGATLRDAARALREAGAEPIAAVAVASTPRTSPPRAPAPGAPARRAQTHGGHTTDETAILT